MEKSTFELLEGEKVDSIALLSQVAHMYYDLDMLQPQIAEQLFFSRSKVSRILKRAQELGIVEIKVNRYRSRMSRYEEKLTKLFDLKKAIVMTNFDDVGGEMAQNDLAACAAQYVSDRLRNECVLGVACGSTVTRVIHHLSATKPCTLRVVQTIGATMDNSMFGASINLAAKTFGGKAYPLNTPLYVEDLYVKQALLNDPSVKAAYALMKKCNVMLMSIGVFDAQGDMPDWHGYMTQEHRDTLDRLGAVGSMCAQFFDADGTILHCDWNEKCIAMPWEDIRRSDLCIAVAAGKSKVPSIIGAIRSGLVDVLITDTATATHLLRAR